MFLKRLFGSSSKCSACGRKIRPFRSGAMSLQEAQQGVLSWGVKCANCGQTVCVVCCVKGGDARGVKVYHCPRCGQPAGENYIS